MHNWLLIANKAPTKNKTLTIQHILTIQCVHKKRYILITCSLRCGVFKTTSVLNSRRHEHLHRPGRPIARDDFLFTINSVCRSTYFVKDCRQSNFYRHSVVTMGAPTNRVEFIQW